MIEHGRESLGESIDGGDGYRIAGGFGVLEETSDQRCRQ